jgi:class 3 adenylate cyclase
MYAECGDIRRQPCVVIDACHRKQAVVTGQFRIGINIGDVTIEGDDLIGDGVLQGLSEPGGICIGKISATRP